MRKKERTIHTLNTCLDSSFVSGCEGQLDLEGLQSASKLPPFVRLVVRPHRRQNCQLMTYRHRHLTRLLLRRQPPYWHISPHTLLGVSKHANTAFKVKTNP